MTVWFTADTHFGHGGARGLFRRPFASTAAMDEALIDGWNAAVDPADTVWHLGDVAVRQKPERVAAILGRLAGTKHLVVGNNDPDWLRALSHWRSVHELVEVTVDGVRLVLCHYPLRSWNGMGKGAWQLHGHSHGRLATLRHQADVGVDAHAFRPVDLAMLRRPRRSGPA